MFNLGLKLLCHLHGESHQCGVDGVAGGGRTSPLLMRISHWNSVSWLALAFFNFLPIICIEGFCNVTRFFFHRGYCMKHTYIHGHHFFLLKQKENVGWTWSFSCPKSKSMRFWSCCSVLNFFFFKDADLARKAFKPVERVLSSTSEEDEPVVVKFLKMNCRYFTDGKVGETWLLGIVWDSLKVKSVLISERWILGESNVLHVCKKCKCYGSFIYHCCVYWYCGNMLYHFVLLIV